MLEQKDGIIVCIMVVFVGTLLLTASRPLTGHWLREDGLMALGLFTGLVLSLFAVGPGNLWPIVIAIDVVLLLPALLIGVAFGELVVLLRKRAG